MSERQLASFSQKSLPDQVHEVVKCGFMKSTVEERVFNPNIGDLNPQNDTDVRAVYTNIDNSNEEKRQASLVKLVLDGYVGTGTIEMGGYDYHNNDRSNTDAKDVQAGEAIGRILELAARKQTDVLVYVFSDGSVSSGSQTVDNTAGDKFRFQSDDANRSSTFMLYYKHAGRPTMKDSGTSFETRGRQIGWFKANQAVERGSNLISNNVTNLSKAVVLNYLALHGDQAKLADLMATDPFKSDADDYILFDKNV